MNVRSERGKIKLFIFLCNRSCCRLACRDAHLRAYGANIPEKRTQKKIIKNRNVNK